jgi:hypothetical protein
MRARGCRAALVALSTFLALGCEQLVGLREMQGRHDEPVSRVATQTPASSVTDAAPTERPAVTLFGDGGTEAIARPTAGVTKRLALGSTHSCILQKMGAWDVGVPGLLGNSAKMPRQLHRSCEACGA